MLGSHLLRLVLFVFTCLIGASILRAQKAESYDRAKLLVQAKPLLGQAKSSKDGLAFSILQRYSSSNTEVVVRVKSGQAEQHAEWADFMIALEGEATVVVGGEMIEGKDTARREIRGLEVRGGERHHLAPGEMLRIPAGVPYQTLVSDGNTCKYLVIKIADKKIP